MTWHGPTFRMSDGEQIDGAWCPVWRGHDLTAQRHPENLFVHADGRITLGRYEETDLAGLERRPAAGRIALTGPGPSERPAPPGAYPAARTADTALRAATRTGSQTGEKGGA
ncbi:hypothetical protein [Streptomyces sp. NPDC059389]|uniref:DUF7638 domain-containing protein n=1 Tax=Streptomyces sp. NPDC059389 TaxID=3346818 RepID=UPI0036878820